MASSSLALFGTPTVSRGTVVVQGLRHKSLALLGYLAVESRPVARDTLATLFWPSSGQSRARANLRSCIWQLSESVGPNVLRVRGDTLTVDVNELLVDVHEFRRLTSAHRRSETDHSDTSQPGGQLLAEAERLYRGSFMEGFTLPDCPEFDTWELFQEELFRRQHSAVLSELIELRVERGLWNEAVRLGERLIELDPLEEESHRQLMRVLARSGRRAAALRQYEACVRVIASELDDDPEPETVSLMEEIKAATDYARPEHAGRDQAPGIGVGQEAMHPFAPVPLPTESTSFVGRTRELHIVRTRLTDGARLLTLTGPAGTGKTRLAIHAAHALAEWFPGGTLFADLSAVTRSDDVASALAVAVGLREAVPGREDLIRVLAERVSEPATLLILDNFEHLLDAAPLVSDLVRKTRQLTLMVTSREPLRVEGEHTLFVPPLDAGYPEVSDSLKLFLDRAHAALGDPLISSIDDDAMRDVCRQLDGLPLAIELAVPLLRVFSAEELAGRLSRPLDYLSGGRHSAELRHGSLQRAIEWSYRLLTEAEARLFSALGVFAGGFTLAAVEHVCGGCGHEAEHPVLLRSLIEKSLVLEQGSSVGGAKRFVLLESVRQYAETCARERNVLAKLNVRHGDYFDAFVRAQAVQLHGASEEHALALLDEEHANIELMLSSIAGQGEVERGLELAELLHWYWYRRARFSRGEYWLSLFLEGQDDARTPLRARGTRALAWMLFIRGAWRRAYSAYAESLYVSRQCGDAHCEAWSLAGVGVTARWMGDVERGTEYTEEAVRVARATGDPYLLLHTLIWAYATTGGSFTGEPPVARLQEAADVARRVGSRWSYAHVLNGLADLFSELGSYEQAESDYLLALHEFDGLGDRWMLAWTEEGLGLLSVRQEDLPRAAAHTARAVALFHELGDELNLAVVLVRLADVHEALGRAAAAARFAGAASTVMDWLANSDLARSPRIEAARERCAGYERIMPLAWAAGRDAPRHRVVEEAQAVELSEDAASAG